MPSVKTSIFAISAFGFGLVSLISFNGKGHAAQIRADIVTGTATEKAISSFPVLKTAAPVRVSANSGSDRLRASLKRGLDSLSKNDFATAGKVRDKLPDGSLEQRVLKWATAFYGGEKVPSVEIAAAAIALSDWPGMAALRRNSERALFGESPSAREVVDAFGGTRPQTFEGTVLLARAQLKLGNRKAAKSILSPFWRTAKLDARDEVSMLKEFGKIISKTDNRFRMERMLYEDRVRSAGRIASRAGAASLHKAWAAVIRKDRKAGKLLDAVPKAQRSAGYIFARAKYLRRKEHFSKAAKLLIDAPGDQSQLIDPDEWWVERRVLSRELIDIGKYRLAYRVAAGHSAKSDSRIADAEFHAGWYALRFLNDAATADRHFANIGKVAKGPISLSRALYWRGRAADSARNGKSAAFYIAAAKHKTAFYGQLAAAKTGSARPDLSFPKPSDDDRGRFEKREMLQAIRLLEQAGHDWRADLFYRQLARRLTSSGELALLAVRAEKRGDHYLALRVGKIAAARGLDIGALAHPMGAIPTKVKISGSGRALAYAIARQESEFNVAAVSRAGARGLLQLLPGTAKDMARKTGLKYSKGRLTKDAGYNAALGSAFLGEQLKRFGGSYILTFAAYNAGPRRAAQWIRKYGDPRNKDLDTAIDWIERIPFTETRNYVQRVMENYQVYKMRLNGSLDIGKDLTKGR